MKIKPLNKQSRKAKMKILSHSYHWWLMPENPPKAGRLSQLQKRNNRMKASNRSLKDGAS